MKNPDCPQCSGNHTYLPYRDDDRTWGCKQCGAIFEPDNEGGDYCTDPTRRIQRAEEREKRERERKQRRARYA